MKNKIYLLLTAVVALFASFLSSCKDDVDPRANAVLTSVRNLNFPVQSADAVMLQIVSDGDWKVETPEWLTVTPNEGKVGKTEVMISVSDNMRDGLIDLPRKYTLQFKGSKVTGAANVFVSQAGDKFRDLAPSTIDNIDALEEDAAVMLNNLVVLGASSKGVMASDGSKVVYLEAPKTRATVDWAAGDKVDVLGSKFTDATQLSYIECTSITKTGTAEIPALQAENITDKLDTYKSKARSMVSVRGVFDGSSLKVKGATNAIKIEDADKALDLSKLKGHIIEVTGIYCGTAAPVVKVYATAVTDCGLNELLYLFEDFEWLEPGTSTYKNSKGASPSDNVGGALYAGFNATSAPNGYYNPLVGTKIFPDGTNSYDKMVAKGFKTVTGKGQESAAVSVARNYLKMGVATYTGGLQLPTMAELGDGVSDVHIAFDWCPWFSKAGQCDATEVIMTIETDGSTKTYTIPAFVGTEYAWEHVEFVISDFKLTKNSVIKIMNIDEQRKDVTGTYFRWFLDNIHVYKPLD